MDLRLAVFVDFENVAIEDTEKDTFQISLVLDRLREKGKILLKRAYADWTRFAKYRRELQDYGVEMIEMTTRGMTQKNAGDIKLVVDALETAFTRDYVNSFVIVSGDSDFSPLVAKLREYNKTVLGLGRRSSTSRLFIEQCDEFILYETLVKQRPAAPAQGDFFSALKDALVALDRQGTSEPHFSRVKEALTRKNPAFDETAAGFKTFGRFLEAAQRKGIVRILRDAATNTSRITLATEEDRAAEAATPKTADVTARAAELSLPKVPEAERAGEPVPAGETAVLDHPANGTPGTDEAPAPAAETVPAAEALSEATASGGAHGRTAEATTGRRPSRRRRSAARSTRAKGSPARRTSSRSTRTAKPPENPAPAKNEE